MTPPRDAAVITEEIAFEDVLEALEDPFPGARTADDELDEQRAAALELATALDEMRRRAEAAEGKLKIQAEKAEELFAEVGVLRGALSMAEKKVQEQAQRLDWQVDVIEYLLDKGAKERNGR
jgi:hypothetical protein